MVIGSSLVQISLPTKVATKHIILECFLSSGALYLVYPYGKIKVKDMEEVEEEEDKKRESTFAVGVLAADTGSWLSKNT